MTTSLKGTFGYISGVVPEIGPDGKYQVQPAKVRVGTVVAEDEIDLESGFLMLPQAIPQEEQPLAPLPAATPSPGGGTVLGTPEVFRDPPAPSPPATPAAVPDQQVIEITFSADRNQLFKAWNAAANLADLAGKVSVTFSADRNQLFKAWNAAANLADLAGKVSVTLRAEAGQGIDKSKLQNGVMEPLQEAGLIE